MTQPEYGRSHDAVHLIKSSDKPIGEIDNQKLLAEKYNDEQ